MLATLLNWLGVELTPVAFRTVHLIVRKGAHVAEYGLLTLLLYRSLAGPDALRWNPRRALVSIALAGVYALSDEFHQLFVRNRGASLLDCGLDLAGASLAIAGLYGRSRSAGWSLPLQSPQPVALDNGR